jgi:hypothetical protein
MRRIKAAIGAMGVAAVALAIGHAAAFPLCVLYTPDDPQYWLFLCYLVAQ